MNDDLRRAITVSAFIVLVIAVPVVGDYLASSLSCYARWHRSGMNSEYGFFTGCVVQREDGTWVPENVLRDVQ